MLELSLEKEGAWARVHADEKLGRASLAFLHEAALKMLGLNNETAPFESRHAEFTAPRRGLRLPNIPTGFDGLAWGIIGQQINVKFASSLRSEIIRMAGEKVGDMRAHPTPERVANMSVAALEQAALFPLQGGLSDRRGESGGEGRAGYRGPAARFGGGGGKKADRPARHRHLDGALYDAARRFRRCGAGGRQRAGDRAAAAA